MDESKDQRNIDRSMLNHEERLVIDEMYDVGYGRFERVLIRNNVPLITKDTKVLRYFHRGQDRGRSVAPARPNRKLRRQHRKFLLYCRQIGNGILERVEVCDGLPTYWPPAQPAMEQLA